MGKMESGRQWSLLVWWLVMVVQLLLTNCYHLNRESSKSEVSMPAVRLHKQDSQMVMDNGIVKVTLSTPVGMVTGIQYNGIHNILETKFVEDNRGYWDVVWQKSGPESWFDRLTNGINFKVILENENQVEVSFTKTWNVGVPINVDKRFVMLRGSSGFYSYAILEHLEGSPGLIVDQVRIIFKLQQNMFQYMAVSDKRQGIMPMAVDRSTGERLDYPEAVRLTSPTNPTLKGQVDDKYQYSCDNKDNRVHGWLCSDPAVGFWMITPSDEFRTGGPLKQDLTSHVGPTVLSMFVSTHYAGLNLSMKFENGEPWKKVFGPIFVYLNSISNAKDPYPALWEDAKAQMSRETANWPYNFPLSEDFPTTKQRGIVRGQLLVNDKYISKELMPAKDAYLGLALPGEVGSWQMENKGYQFWSQADMKGYFVIKGVRTGIYDLYAWVPGVLGDYKYSVNINITTGCDIQLNGLIYEPPRNGPTLWEIGLPDRTAAEFYIPDPNPLLINPRVENFRQYGLWSRYTDLYPRKDLVYKVGLNDYRRDWFFAHVNRIIGNNTYHATTWKIIFELNNTNMAAANYTLQLALASANDAELQVGINDQNPHSPHFTTGLIGRDNSIARHGIHGLYWCYSINVEGSKLVNGKNIIFLTQSKASSLFQGVMYDYIRLEGRS